LNQYLSVLPSDLQQYLSAFAANHRPGTVEGYLDQARNLRVLVVGEAIIDEYEYCEAIGKSGKEPIIVTRHIRNDRFLGGSLSVANQAAAFADHVTLLTFIGDTVGNEHLIDSKLNPGIERMFLRLPGVSTITKKQFVQVYPMQKLFEVDVLDSKESFANHIQALCGRLRDLLPQYDVVIVSDHGHGMLGHEAVNVLCRGPAFLAVTTQMNADNHGFHTISKYPRADYISISENDLRLEARSRTDDLHDIVRALSDELSCPRIVVIQGQQGCLCYSKEEGFQAVPAFGSRIVDRKGATDSMLAVTALCAAQHAPIEVLGFVANAVGAQAVSVVGNPGPVTRVPLLRQVDCLLK
jgi:bifunctional ADP-heptose synthase (sugar kinase/adenylyltransferase)